ncbi:Uncharacterised protein [Anaerotruncus colihominis]|uniref:Uncharacterized protein n=1 Tax=Anaerotruncus colihominis TaxID=169435 RepID=A0A174MSK9_9FIRM|nr:Uncharacterised protein [Anaerotruncus colihominis]
MVFFRKLREQITDISADGEIFAHIRFPLRHICKILNIMGAILVAEALRAGGNHDQYRAVVGDAHLIGNCFGGLIEIDILRISARRSDYKISPALHMHTVHFMNQRAGCPVRRDPMAGKGRYNILIGIGYDIEQEIGLCKSGGLLHIAVEGIAGLQIAAVHIGIGAAADSRIQSEIVIMQDSVDIGNSRNNRFSSSAVTGKEMIYNASGQNQTVAVKRGAVEPDRRTARCGSDIAHLFLLAAIMIDCADTCIKRFADQTFPFGFCLSAVRSCGAYN